MSLLRSLPLFLTIVWLLPAGCSKSPKPPMMEEPSPVEPKPGVALETALSSSPNLPPPETAEVRSKIARIFKESVAVDRKRNPYFVVGDFNGDLSQDLAVTVKPEPGRLPQINDELANWILVNPMQPPTTRDGGHRGSARQQRFRVTEGDALLAVIHGFGSDGWRNRDATQTYVLKNISESALNSRPHSAVNPANKEKLPRIWGDVIPQTISGQLGFLYFNGATYAWYDPVSVQVAPPRRRAHQATREE